MEPSAPAIYLAFAATTGRREHVNLVRCDEQVHP